MTIICALAAFAISASAYDGGIKAKVVNRSGRVPVQGATVSLSFDDEVIKTVKSAPDGSFFFEDLPDGRYTVSVDADEFLSTKLNVTVENGIVRDLMFVTLSAVRRAEEVDASNLRNLTSTTADTPMPRPFCSAPTTYILTWWVTDSATSGSRTAVIIRRLRMYILQVCR